MEVNVTAIVPVWNGRELLAKLLKSLALQTRLPAEVIVVDNGSTDGAPQLAAEQGVRVIPMHRNAGFAAAVNRGIAESRTEWLAILNSDVELAPDWIEKLTARDTWFATGKILSISTGRIDGTWDLSCRSGCSWRAGQGRHDAPPFNAEREIAAAPMTALMVRAELFRKIGPLDERFESYLEDVDFGWRAATAGFTGLYIPDAICRHHGSAALGKWHDETTRRISRNQVFLIAKHFPKALQRRWWWPILAGQVLWGLVALRHGALIPWLRGKIEGIRRFETVGDARIENLLTSQEREICTIQHNTGFDLYWQLYFALVGRSDTRATHE